eukprot:c12473_g1_i3.p2 GENE.c12473_g1_i3~~c12473_g1_i3.p2  ORF type:complete len:181 (+),score=45.88 c12473_g1_i3:92-634(+)
MFTDSKLPQFPGSSVTTTEMFDTQRSKVPDSSIQQSPSPTSATPTVVETDHRNSGILSGDHVTFAPPRQTNLEHSSNPSVTSIRTASFLFGRDSNLPQSPLQPSRDHVEHSQKNQQDSSPVHSGYVTNTTNNEDDKQSNVPLTPPKTSQPAGQIWNTQFNQFDTNRKFKTNRPKNKPKYK